MTSIMLRGGAGIRYTESAQFSLSLRLFGNRAARTSLPPSTSALASRISAITALFGLNLLCRCVGVLADRSAGLATTRLGTVARQKKVIESGRNGPRRAMSTPNGKPN